MQNLIPLITAILNRLGGADQVAWIPFKMKWFRWLGIGAVIGLIYHSWLPVFTYYIATNIPYGEKSWLNFLGEYGKFAVCGALLGLASIVVLGPVWGVIQAIVGAVAWVVIKYLDDNGEIVNPLTELARGLGASIIYWLT